MKMEDSGEMKMENLRPVYDTTHQQKFQTERCIAAWTQNGGYKYYPPYVNITLMADGTCRLIIRGPERISQDADDKEVVLVGGQLTLFLPLEEAKTLFEETLKGWEWGQRVAIP